MSACHKSNNFLLLGSIWLGLEKVVICMFLNLGQCMVCSHADGSRIGHLCWCLVLGLGPFLIGIGLVVSVYTVV